MCTLILAWHALEDAPIAVAANRDESLERPAEPPGVYATDPLIIAPKDVRAGGTWIGYNEHGVFAGITNRWTDAELPGDRSRGLLVADVLEHSTASDAAAALERAVDAAEYEGFNFVIADEDDAVYFEWDGSLRRHALEPGVHVVVNTGFDGRFDIPDHRPEAARRQAENARTVRRALAVNANDFEGGPESGGSSERDEGTRVSTDWLERAGRVLGDHEYGVCIHGDGFGTRSSSLIVLGDTRAYKFANGPPCRTPYESAETERHI